MNKRFLTIAAALSMGVALTACSTLFAIKEVRGG